MYVYFLLLISLFPILIKSENCTVLWNIDNLNSRMKIKMCIMPIEQTVIIDNNIIFNNLSKLVNITDKTQTKINETITNISFSPSPLKNNFLDRNISPSSFSPSPLKDIKINISISPSSFDDELFETIIIPSPAPYNKFESIVKVNSPSINNINDTFLKRNQTNINIITFDTAAFVSILIISIFLIVILSVYIIKKRKRQNVQPMCKFNKTKTKKKVHSLERPKDYIIEHMVENPLCDDKNKETKTEVNKTALMMV